MKYIPLNQFEEHNENPYLEKVINEIRNARSLKKNLS